MSMEQQLKKKACTTGLTHYPTDNEETLVNILYLICNTYTAALQ